MQYRARGAVTGVALAWGMVTIFESAAAGEQRIGYQFAIGKVRCEDVGRACMPSSYKDRNAQSESGRMSSKAAPARPGEIAIREEYELLKRKGTVEALQLFIDRHPDHPLAVDAREGIRRILARQKD